MSLVIKGALSRVDQFLIHRQTDLFQDDDDGHDEHPWDDGDDDDGYLCFCLSNIIHTLESQMEERKRKILYKIKEGGTVDRTRPNEEKPITK